MTGTLLLEALGLTKTFSVEGAALVAVRDVDLRLRPRETLALVGESGCGKTTLARALTLLDPPSAGSVKFDGREITGVPARALRPVRRRMQLVFQDPFGSLNPRLTVGRIVAEPLVIHGIGLRNRRRERTADLLESVGLKADDMTRYPHQFSGGQRQRIAIARALAPDPELIIADEPVSALDVSVQSQILNLMADLRVARGLAYLFIGHDLAVVRHMADRVAVMYLGRVVEEAPAAELFADPRHPYTRSLIAATPHVGRGKRRPGKTLGGDMPSPLSPLPGCPFHPRCPMAEAVCREARPALDPLEGSADRRCACHFREREVGP